jgi:TetR/AcrR family transcriptional regulator, transcriptional repressor for nem operon
MATASTHESKTKLLDAAMNVIRAKGYAGSTIDDVCAAAGVTKGSFFHHFKSKDEVALASVAHFALMADGLFGTAPYTNAGDPLQRLLGYIDFRDEILTGELPEYTCLLGTLVQETYDTHPAIRIACDTAMSAHVAMLTRDIALAKQRYAPKATWSVDSVGFFIQSVLQGSFIFAKAKQSPEVIRASLCHLRAYLVELFNHPKTTQRRGASHVQKDFR